MDIENKSRKQRISFFEILDRIRWAFLHEGMDTKDALGKIKKATKDEPLMGKRKK